MKLPIALFVAAIIAGDVGFGKVMAGHYLAMPVRVASLALLVAAVIALVRQDERARRKMPRRRKA